MSETKMKSESEISTLKTVNNNLYIVKSVFVGNKEIKDLLYKIAEKKTVNEMGLTYATI